MALVLTTWLAAAHPAVVEWQLEPARSGRVPYASVAFVASVGEGSHPPMVSTTHLVASEASEEPIIFVVEVMDMDFEHARPGGELRTRLHPDPTLQGVLRHTSGSRKPMELGIDTTGACWQDTGACWQHGSCSASQISPLQINAVPFLRCDVGQHRGGSGVAQHIWSRLQTEAHEPRLCELEGAERDYPFRESCFEDDGGGYRD